MIRAVRYIGKFRFATDAKELLEFHQRADEALERMQNKFESFHDQFPSMDICLSVSNPLLFPASKVC